VYLQSTDDAKDETTVARIGRLEEQPNGDRSSLLETAAATSASPARSSTG